MNDPAPILPTGRPLPDWTPRPVPPHAVLEGRLVRLEPLDPQTHAAALYEADALDRAGASWTYLPYGPFPGLDAYRGWVADMAASRDPLFYALVDRGAGPVGVASFLRIVPATGVIEVGHIHLSPLAQRRPCATEAMYLMMRHVFDDLGYRRYEWKCDALNAASRRAAQRLGFTFEGEFRQATIYKGRNRDTAWFSVIDGEWPVLKARFEAWLDPANFDAEGRQRRGLGTAG